MRLFRVSLNYTFNYSIMISEICCEAKIGKINTKEHKDGKMALGACCKTKREYNAKKKKKPKKQPMEKKTLFSNILWIIRFASSSR